MMQVPIHAFLCWPSCSGNLNFKEIADATGGRSELLDINSSGGADMLTDLVTREILRNVF